MGAPKRSRAAPGAGKPATALESILQQLQQPYYAWAHRQRQRVSQRRSEPQQRPQSAAPAKQHTPSTRATALGSVLFALLVFLAGAYPFLLPHIFLLFCFTAIPWRVYSFAVAEPRNAFFLCDFCYLVCGAVCLFLLAPPAARDPRLEAALYAVADGPVAFALVAWECAWVWSSSEHTISVLMHLLPGLAMYSHHHLPRLASWQALKACAGNLRHASTALHLASCVSDSASAGALAGGASLGGRELTWLFAVPLAIYLVWQLLYFLIVQVLCGKFIKRHGLDTSYKCMIRRGARANTLLSRIVVRGSLAYRLTMYAALQLAFTVATLVAFLPTYYSFHAAAAWQFCKFLPPLYHGARYSCERLIKAGIADGVRRHIEAQEAQAAAAPAGRRRASAAAA